MGVVTYELEVTCAHPPAKMFKAFVLEADNLFRKVLPQEVKSGELLEGDEGVGSIKKVTFVEGDKTTYLKHKIDAIDKENFVFCYTSFEGDFLVNKFEKISHETKWVPSPDGGSIFKSTTKFYTLPGFEMPEDLIKYHKQKATNAVKAFEAYLQANPDAC
ncbi:major allergen Pru av 1-like [Pistacia vera]|uniref:major allergen Pru av 1-like n=1 Tax=Pistacia vera TaxID=55513 RepID=UPI001262C25C|nr:major allergen Pru av 1-like [Pistacia vera]